MKRKQFPALLLVVAALLASPAAAVAPTVTANISGTLGDNGWYVTPVTVSWSVTDGTECADDVIPPGDTPGYVATCESTNEATGETTTEPVTIKIDQTAPTISAPGRTPGPNGNGWNNENVTVTWNCADADPGSGVVSATASDTVASEGANQTASGTCRDNAGHTDTASVSGIDIDKTAPAANADPSRAPDSNGWYTSPLTITFGGSDALSGIASCVRSNPVAYSGPDTAGTPYSNTCTDNAGNTSPQANFTLKYDATAPNTTINNPPATPTNVTSVNLEFVSSDSGTFECDLDGSGFAVCSSPRTYSGLPEGDHTFRVRGIDAAGNVDETPFIVNWTIDLTPGDNMRRPLATPGDAVVVLTYSFPPGINRVQIKRKPTGPGFPVVRRRARFVDRTVRNGRLYTYELRSLDPVGNLSEPPVTVSARPRDPLLAPRDGARVLRSRSQLFRWVGVAHAKRYNMQLWRRRPGRRPEKVLSVFPFAPQYQLPPVWRYHGRHRLIRGSTYDWYVYPWFGTRYGKLVGRNWFRVL